MADNSRDTTIAAIRAALKRRSGRAWSVTGGRGTAWGWIKIDAPPARCTWRHVEKADYVETPGEPWRDRFDDVDTGRPGGHMSPTDAADLAALLGLEPGRVYDGVSIAASSAYYREYVQRAQGEPVTTIAQPYWD